jgi:hypothetical protein
MVENTEIIVNRRIRTNLSLLGSPASLTGTFEAMEVLFREGGESFYNYISWLGLAKDPDIVMLSSKHHYYFDTDDFQYIKTLVNVRQLNQIKNLDGFLQSIFQNIHSKCNFVGSYFACEGQNSFIRKYFSPQYRAINNIDPIEHEITSRIPFLNTVLNLIDLKTNNYLTRSDVTRLLERNGFKVLDMTEINGITYFHSLKVPE